MSRKITETRAQLIKKYLKPEISVSEVGILLGVKPGTVRKYSDAGNFPSHRNELGHRQFYFYDILKYIENKKDKNDRK